MIDWYTILTREQIAAHYARMASLDPRMARQTREWYESRTFVQLRTIRAQAWTANDRETFCLANSYMEHHCDQPR